MNKLRACITYFCFPNQAIPSHACFNVGMLLHNMTLTETFCLEKKKTLFIHFKNTSSSPNP